MIKKDSIIFNKLGQDNSAVFITLNQIFSLFNKLPARTQLDNIIFVIDKSGSIKHRQLLPDYKNKRAKTSSALYNMEADKKDNGFREMDVVKELLLTFPYSAALEIDNAEGDLVLSYALFNYYLNEKNIVMTGDKDYIQLLKFYPHIILYFLANKYKGFITPQNFAEKLQLPFITPYEYLFSKIIIGDPSDNIPGIPGMGKKKTEIFIKALREDVKNNPEILNIDFMCEKLISSFKFLKDKNKEEIKNILLRNTQLINLTDFNLLSLKNKEDIDLIINNLKQKPFKGDIKKFKNILERENIPIKYETELMLYKIFRGGL